MNVKTAVFSEENLTFFYECQNSSVLRGELNIFLDYGQMPKTCVLRERTL